MHIVPHTPSKRANRGGKHTSKERKQQQKGFRFPVFSFVSTRLLLALPIVTIEHNTIFFLRWLFGNVHFLLLFRCLLGK